jgi:hypothetical protein
MKNRLTERDISRIVKQVISEDMFSSENRFTKMRRRDGEPIVKNMDLVMSVLSDLSLRMADEYDLEEFDRHTNIPEYLLPYLDEIAEVVSNIDTLLIWDAVYESLDTPEVNELINRIVSDYGENN